MIPSIAAAGASAASQMLSSLMSALSPSSSSSSDSTSTASASTFAMSGCVPSTGSNALTGSSTGQLSGQILMTLMSMQQQGGGATATSGTSTASSDPLQQLFSAMDTNGDGSVSQSEMQSYIENTGGTQADADSLFSALSQNGSSASAATGTASGISESQMSSAVGQAQQAQQSQGGGHHHHHHKVQGNSADSAANTLMQALDTNDDGSVSQDEFTSFVTANGGTSADASSDFAALNTSGSASLTSADFAKAWSNLQAQQASQSSGSMVVSLLDAFSKAGGTGASTTSISA